MRVIEPLYDELATLAVSTELVLVANYHPGSNDGTPAVVEEFAHGREGVTVVAEPKRGAMGWDMRSGLEAARGQYMVVIDGDEQNPVEDVIGMYWHMRRLGADVMKGRRIARFDGYLRHGVSIAYNLLFLAMFRTTALWDVNGKPKGLTRHAYQQLSLRSDDWFIDAEIVLEARRLGLRVEEMPVVFRKNPARSSFVRAQTVIEFLRNMVKRRLRRRA